MSAPLPLPSQPATLDEIRAAFWDRSAWRKSAKGNHWIFIAGRPVTIFPVRIPGGATGFKWSIGPKSVRGLGPRYSRETYDDAKAAHSAAWDALEALVERMSQ